MPTITSAAAFRAAAEKLIRSNGHGGQVELARHLHISKGYLGDLIAGRKDWTDPLRDSLAQHYGLSVAEMLMIGEEFLRTGNWFSYGREVAGMPPHSLERASKLWVLAAQEFRLPDSSFLSPSAIRGWVPRIDDYLARNISDAEMYQTARNYFKRLLYHYLPK